MSYLNRVDRELQKIRDEHQYRELPLRQLADVIDFSSNDYLGMAKEPQVLEALKHAKRAGSGGARLLAGRNRELSLLEEELAGWLGRERALLFSSGYLAGVGAIPVLAELVATIYSDRANHASLIDGIRLLGRPAGLRARDAAAARCERIGARRQRDALRDGRRHDRCCCAARATPPRRRVALRRSARARRDRPGRRGPRTKLADPRVLILGTLSKALGTLGGFVAGPAAPSISSSTGRAALSSIPRCRRRSRWRRASRSSPARRGGPARAPERQRRAAASRACDRR